MILPRTRRTLIYGLTALIFAGCGIALSNYVRTEKPRLSDELYQLSLPTPAGQNNTLSQWRNKPLVVNFWATWCAPCVEEMPALSALQTQLTQSGQAIQLIGIGIDSPDNIIEFTKKFNIRYPQYVAGMSGTQLSQQLGNTTGGLPFTILINKSGDIVKTYSGRLSMPTLRKDLAMLQQ